MLYSNSCVYVMLFVKIVYCTCIDVSYFVVVFTGTENPSEMERYV